MLSLVTRFASPRHGISGDASPKADMFRVSLFSTLTIDFPSGCWEEWEEVLVT